MWSWGADVPVNYRTSRVEELAATFDIVVDTEGGLNGPDAKWHELLAPNNAAGIFVIIVGNFSDGKVTPEAFAASMEYSEQHAPRFKQFFVDQAATADLEALRTLVEAGMATPMIAPEIYTLETLYDALMTHRMKGKLVVRV